MLLLLVELSQLSHLENISTKLCKKAVVKRGVVQVWLLLIHRIHHFTLQQITFPYRYLTLGKKAHISGGHMVVRVDHETIPVRDGLKTGSDLEWSRVVTMVRVMSYPYKGLNLLKHTMNLDLYNDLCTKKPDIYIYRYVYIYIYMYYIKVCG